MVQKTEDSYKNLRTNIVLLYAITNGALAIGILGGAGSTFASDGGNTRTSVYMTFLLGSVAGLACELARYTETRTALTRILLTGMQVSRPLELVYI